MKRLISLCCAVAIPMLYAVPFTLHAATKAERRLAEIKNRPTMATIKVLVLQDVEGALVEIKGPYNVYDPHTGKKLESVFSSSSYYMHPTIDGIKWGAEFPGIFQVLLVPDSPKTKILVHGIEYYGMLYAYQVDGAIGFVNEVTLDDYADSIVAGAYQDDIKAPEALAALVIAARTDAYYKSLHGKNKYWDVKASTTGYQGAAVTVQDPDFRKVVQATSKMILRSPQPIVWFANANPVVPMKELQERAEEGKDARAILAQFFGENPIVLAGDK